MDVKPPQSTNASFTIAQAKWLNNFSNLVGSVVGAIALLDQSGAFFLLPAKLQKYVTPVALTTGVVALLAGQNKQGAALIANHSGRPYVYTPEGTPGRDQKDALNQVFMSDAEVAIARKAVAGELVPPNIAPNASPPPKPGLDGLTKRHKVSLSDLAAIATNHSIVPDEVI
jgi:hypothetical protein